MRRKYGSLPSLRRKMKAEHAKTLEQHKQEIAQEPGYLDEVLLTIQKHDGRISQKQLRNEMLHLSEAKISLILTELEHKGKIEKIKKGRGNVIVVRKVRNSINYYGQEISPEEAKGIIREIERLQLRINSLLR